MPEEFAKSTLLALKAQQEILQMPLEECDPHFKAKLAAKASTASQQITAQLRADEERLRGQIAAISYYDEL
jgi:septal ring factor EnvC (AmiA/AmiB activator)